MNSSSRLSLLGGQGGKCFSPLCPLAQHPERSEGQTPDYPPRKWPL